MAREFRGLGRLNARMAKSAENHLGKIHELFWGCVLDIPLFDCRDMTTDSVCLSESTHQSLKHAVEPAPQANVQDQRQHFQRLNPAVAVVDDATSPDDLWNTRTC